MPEQPASIANLRRLIDERLQPKMPYQLEESGASIDITMGYINTYVRRTLDRRDLVVITDYPEVLDSIIDKMLFQWARLFFRKQPDEHHL